MRNTVITTSVVISVCIPRELKEKLEKINVNISELVRKCLEKYIEEAEMRKLEEKLKKLRIRLAGRVSPVLIAKLIREDRNRR